ncbi:MULTISPECIES: hypothetical protein [unclassified Bradyrhizobium]
MIGPSGTQAAMMPRVVRLLWKINVYFDKCSFQAALNRQLLFAVGTTGLGSERGKSTLKSEQKAVGVQVGERYALPHR